MNRPVFLLYNMTLIAPKKKSAVSGEYVSGFTSQNLLVIIIDIFNILRAIRDYIQN